MFLTEGQFGEKAKIHLPSGWTDELTEWMYRWFKQEGIVAEVHQDANGAAVYIYEGDSSEAQRIVDTLEAHIPEAN